MFKKIKTIYFLKNIHFHKYVIKKLNIFFLNFHSPLYALMNKIKYNLIHYLQN